MKASMYVVFLALLLLSVGLASAAAMTVTIVSPADDTVDADGLMTAVITTDYNMTSALITLVYPSGTTDSTTMTVDGTKKSATYTSTLTLPEGRYQWYVTTVNATDESSPGRSSTYDFIVDDGSSSSAAAYVAMSQNSNIEDEERTGMSTGMKLAIALGALLAIAYFGKMGPFKKR